MIKLSNQNKLLGNFIKKARLKRGYSGRKLAELADTSQSYLSQIEQGLKIPNPDLLSRIARGLNISYLRLLELSGHLDEATIQLLEDTAVTEFYTDVISQFIGIDQREMLHEMDNRNISLYDKSRDFDELERDKILLVSLLQEMHSRESNDLDKLLQSELNIYYKDRLLSKEEKEKLLTITKTILD